MYENYTLRLVQKSEATDILKLYHSLIGSEGCTWSLDYPTLFDIESDIAANSLLCFCDEAKSIVAVAAIVKGDELIGLNWDKSINNPCEFSRLGVHANMLGQGVGTAFLLRLINNAKEQGFDGVRMLVSTHNIPALALYKKFDFACRDRVFMYEIDFFCYELKL